jgi:hypothetical protein
MVTRLILTDDGGDSPINECTNCGMKFHLIWQASPMFCRPCFCPFCGDDVFVVDMRRGDDEDSDL